MTRAEYIPIPTAAERYQVSTRTLERRLASGHLTRHTDGRNLRLTLLSTAELDDMCKVAPAA